MLENAKLVAELLRLMANANRLMILCLLLEKPCTVTELAEQVQGITMSALSQHLQKLRQSNLIQAQKQGQYVWYSLKDERIRALMAVLKENYCNTHM